MDKTELVIWRILEQLDYLAEHTQTNLTEFAYRKSMEIVQHELEMYRKEKD